MSNIDPEIHDKIIKEIAESGELEKEERAFGDGDINETDENR